MSFNIETFPHDHIIVLTLNDDFEFMPQLATASQAIDDILDAQPDRYTLITVFCRKLSLEEILHTANVLGRGRGSLWHHRKLKQVIIVTDDIALREAAGGMASTAFGNLQIAVYDTLAAALEAAMLH